MKIRKSEKEVCEALDEWQNFCFDAGPGAGKTYTLIKAIEHIISKNENLNNYDHQILCITYTNAAKDEIEKRIGKNSEVLISTIHDFLWDFISSQKNLLKVEHKNKLCSVIQNLQNDIKNNSIRIDNIDDFEEIICTDNFKSVFYENYSKKAQPFRESILTLYPMMDKYLSNASKFKSSVYKLLKKKRLKDTFNDILKGKGKNILYDSIHNQDRLDQYLISHDTLLEFSKDIISKNAILKRLFIDRYPYVLIDEYQDTDSKVIDLFSSVLKYSSNKHRIVIGFFGDSKQNIYEHGIGSLNKKLDLRKIEEPENMRSCKAVVDVINRIRNDRLKQSPTDQGKGSCEFYKSSSKNENKFDFSAGTTAYLFMKNSRIAEARHFENLYMQLRKFTHFAYRSNTNNLNDEFFQNNVRNVGWFLKNILNLIDFKIKIEDKDENSPTTVKDVQKYININSSITFGEFKKFLAEVRQIKTTHITLGEYINSLYKIKGRLTGKDIIFKSFFGDNENHKKGEINVQAVDYFYNDKGINETQNIEIKNFFDLDISEFENWYRYVFRVKSGAIDYYTLHGSKGLEFDNVVVVLQDDFAHRKDYFKYFFKNYGNENRLNNKEIKKFDEARNLLYVACSRAKSNLRVIYETDDCTQVEESIKKIFGKLEELK